MPEATSPLPRPPLPRGARSFDDFLAALLTVESGIDPALFAWYVREYDAPVLLYPSVATPGRVVRDRATGGYGFVPTTVAHYFRALGVEQLFDPASPACMRAMQYASTNALGFVGYQFGEAALIRTGHYRPEVVRVRRGDGFAREFASYYVGSVPEAAWRGGRTEVLHRVPGTRRYVLATDVNRWRGTFTGKHGVCGFEDLKDPQRQELVMRACLDEYDARLRAILTKHGFDVGAARAGWSGLLAAAHLCGPEGTAAFVAAGVPASDEFQTDIRTYLEAFAGFETPYHS